MYILEWSKKLEGLGRDTFSVISASAFLAITSASGIQAQESADTLVDGFVQNASNAVGVKAESKLDPKTADEPSTKGKDLGSPDALPNKGIASVEDTEVSTSAGMSKESSSTDATDGDDQRKMSTPVKEPTDTEALNGDNPQQTLINNASSEKVEDAATPDVKVPTTKMVQPIQNPGFLGGVQASKMRQTEVVLDFRPLCSLVKVDHGFMSGC